MDANLWADGITIEFNCQSRVEIMQDNVKVQETKRVVMEWREQRV